MENSEAFYQILTACVIALIFIVKLRSYYKTKEKQEEQKENLEKIYSKLSDEEVQTIKEAINDENERKIVEQAMHENNEHARRTTTNPSFSIYSNNIYNKQNK